MGEKGSLHSFTQQYSFLSIVVRGSEVVAAHFSLSLIIRSTIFYFFIYIFVVEPLGGFSSMQHTQLVDEYFFWTLDFEVNIFIVEFLR